MIPPVGLIRRRAAAGDRPAASSAIEAPPPRYRIVEQGRRLVVIDTRPPTDFAPANGTLLEGHPLPRTALPATTEASTKLVLLWTALVFVAIGGVLTVAYAGIGTLIAVGIVIASLYTQQKARIDDWIASLN